MRQALKSKNPHRGSISYSVSLPAPVGGLNAKDPWSQMDQKYAVALENFFPAPNYVELRPGSSAHITDNVGTDIADDNGIQSLMVYNTGAGAQKLFGATDVKIYDCTSAGEVPAAAVSSLTNGRWQYINVATTGGAYLMAVNGADSLLLYDGSTWTAITGVSSPAITGVTTADIIGINLFKNRVWLIEKASLKAWYLPTSAISGAATLFDLRSIFPRGGYLMAIGTWTIDAGYGMDDHLAFITSEGEVAIYRGTDPASAATWALVGRFLIGSPIGRRCMEQYASDLCVVSKDGLITLGKSLMTSRVNTATSLSDLILPIISDAITDYGSSFGWQVVLHPIGDALILNVPVTGGSVQYVMNTVSGAWCKFTGWDALCWARYNDEIYYGHESGVMKAWTGTSDNGSNIVGNGLQAFNYLGKNTALKHVKMMRPVLATDVDAGLLAGVNVDFDTSDPTGTLSVPASSGGVWGTATWDSGVWGGDLTITKDWQFASGIGWAIAPHLKVSTARSRLRWFSTDLQYEEGGTL